MDLRLFSTFLRVAELQNFTKAAEQLGYSQATVTVQIHQLEQALGIQLFERIGKRVRMTERGEQFIPYAIEILKAEQNAKDFLREPENPSGRLRIGTAESLLLSVLTPILMEYHHRYPDVMVSIHTGLIHELFDMVRQNDVDLLFFLDKKTDFAKLLLFRLGQTAGTAGTHPICCFPRSYDLSQEKSIFSGSGARTLCANGKKCQLPL